MLEGEEVISSQLFLIEVSNAFWKYHKAGLLDEKTVCANIEKAIALVDEFCDLDKTQCCEATKEAMRLRHPVYDMLYFVLARRNAATLFTLDRKLQQLCLDNGGGLCADRYELLAGRSRAFCMKPDTCFDPRAFDTVQWLSLSNVCRVTEGRRMQIAVLRSKEPTL